MLHDERRSRLDQTSAAFRDVLSVLGDGQVIQELAGQVIAGTRHHVGAVQAHAKARRMAKHVQQHDVAEEVVKIERVYVAAAWKPANTLALDPIEIKPQEPLAPY